MRVISSKELDLVSGGLSKLEQTTGNGSFWDSVNSFVSLIFGGSFGSSSNSCVPSSNSAGGFTTTQTCGAGGVSTVTTTSRGYFSQSTTTPNPDISFGGKYGPGSFKGGQQLRALHY